MKAELRQAIYDIAVDRVARHGWSVKEVAQELSIDSAVLVAIMAQQRKGKRRIAK